MGFQVNLNTPKAARASLVLVPAAFGIWSMMLGADENWDLYNYHLYNPFAFLNRKQELDLAPGGIQSFFNPFLDLPYYLAITHLPGPVVGFLMGTLHGLAFVLALSICRTLIGSRQGHAAYRTTLLLALAGCLTANFLSELGNTMGDNTTAVLCLAGLALLVSRWDLLVERPVWSITAGMLIGLAAGLKLTNGITALACCIGFAVFPASLGSRIRIAAFFVAGCVIGALATGGYWHFELWRTYGNPLFPLFNNVFQHPLVAAVPMADTRWLPKDWGERLAWPFVISLNAQRVGEAPVRQIIWAIVYAAFIAWGFVTALRRAGRIPSASLDPRARFVVTVVGAGFVVWMLTFSVYRYLVPLEVLAPLVVFLLLSHSLPSTAGARVAGWSLAIATATVLAGGLKTWGHAAWGEAPFVIDAPRIEHPASTTVVITGGSTAWAWLGVGFPREVALTQVGGNLPEGPAFRSRLNELISRGPAFAVITGHRDNSEDRGKGLRGFVEKSGLTGSPEGCTLLRYIADSTRARFVVGEFISGTCTIQPRRDPLRSVQADNQAEREMGARILAKYGYEYLSCEERDAFLAGAHRVFQWCPLRSLTPTARHPDH
jgi:hypothetical protein